eukprot:gene7886-1099_t
MTAELHATSGKADEAGDAGQKSVHGDCTLSVVKLMKQDAVTVYAFASPGNRKAAGPLDKFQELLQSPSYKPLLMHDRVETQQRIQFDANKYVEILVVFSDNTGLPGKRGRFMYVWEVCKLTVGSTNCWLTQGVQLYDHPRPHIRCMSNIKPSPQLYARFSKHPSKSAAASRAKGGMNRHIVFGSAASKMARPVLRGVVFDMDGTLTIPNLDFALMYKRCNVPIKDDLIRVVNAMPKAEKDAAWRVIDDMEEEGRRTLQLKRGVVELASWLKHHKVRTAVVTRNSAVTLDHLTSNLWKAADLPPFSVALSRDDTSIPPKPDPEALRVIAGKWGVDPGPDLLMVGDSPSMDVLFGKAAGSSTALLDSGRRFLEDGSDKGADFCVEYLYQLPALIWNHFEVPGNTPLIWAADQGQVGAVSFLVKMKVNGNAHGFLGATALCRGSQKGHIDVLEALLQAPGINCDLANNKMQDPLHFVQIPLNFAQCTSPSILP